MSLQSPTILDIKIKQNKTLILNILGLNTTYDIQLSNTGLTTDWSGISVTPFNLGNKYQLGCNFHNLLYNTPYYIRIRAYVNETQFSSWIYYTVNNQLIPIQFKKYPLPPSNLQVNQLANGNLSLTWNPVQEVIENTGGYSIEKYKIFAYTDPTFITQIKGIPIDTIETHGIIPAEYLEFGKKHYIKVAAFDEIGQEGSKTAEIEIIPTTSPAAPLRVNLTPADSSITVRWVPGANNGYSISEYKFYTLISGESSRSLSTNFVTFDDNSATIHGLTNGLYYYVLVSAVNLMGEGPTLRSPIAVKPVAMPYVSNISGVSLSERVTLNWTENRAGSNYIYLNFQKSTDGPDTGFIDIPLTDVERQTNSATIRGLINGLDYWFSIRARNENGYGPYTVFGPIVPLDIPYDLNVLSRANNQQLELTWFCKTFSPIIEIEAQIRIGTQDEYVNILSNSSYNVQNIFGSKKLQILDLVNGQQYTFRIRLRNRIGFSNYFYISDTPRTIPNRPNLTVRTSNESLFIDIIPQADGGKPIKEYIVELSGNNVSYEKPWYFSWIKDTPAEVVPSGIHIFELENGKLYDIRVAAVNEIGKSVWNYTTGRPQKKPSNPVITYTTEDKSLLLEWYVEDYGGANQLEYNIYVDGSLIPRSYIDYDGIYKQTISNLINEKEYRIEIEAINENTISNRTILLAIPKGYPMAPFTEYQPLSYSSVKLLLYEPSNKGGYSIIGYKVVIGGIEQTVPISNTEYTEYTEYTINMLQKGLIYDISIAAVNTYGTGEYIPMRIATFNDSIVRFKTIIQPNCTINGYYIYYRDVGPNELSINSTIVNQLQQDICGATYLGNPAIDTEIDVLVPFTNPLRKYEYTIRAFNSVSIGPPSKVPAYIPTNFTGTFNGNLVLSWNSDHNYIYSLTAQPQITDNNIQYGQLTSSLTHIKDKTITLKDLSYNISYTFSLIAKDIHNKSVSSPITYTTTILPIFYPMDISYSHVSPGVIRLKYRILDSVARITFRGLVIEDVSGVINTTQSVEESWINIVAVAPERNITFRIRQQYNYNGSIIVSQPSEEYNIYAINVPNDLLLSDISYSFLVDQEKAVSEGKAAILIKWQPEAAVAAGSIRRPFAVSGSGSQSCGFAVTIQDAAAAAATAKTVLLPATASDISFHNLLIGNRYIIKVAVFNQSGTSNGTIINSNGILISLGNEIIETNERYAVENESIEISGQSIIVKWSSVDSLFNEQQFTYSIRGYKYSQSKAIAGDTRDPIEEYIIGSIVFAKGEEEKVYKFDIPDIYGYYYSFFIDFIYTINDIEGCIELDEVMCPD